MIKPADADALRSVLNSSWLAPLAGRARSGRVSYRTV
jgi:hypothetical protein